jgi:hypothetical protein
MSTVAARLGGMLGLLACALVLTTSAAQAESLEGEFRIHSPYSSTLYFNAEHCAKDTHVYLYPKTSGCGDAANEVWTIEEEPETEYDVIYSDYGGFGPQCLNVNNYEYKQRTEILAWNCDPLAPASNELFRKPGRTEDKAASAYYIIPGRQPEENQFCLNANGGLHEGAHIILWKCEAVENELWRFEKVG